MKHSPRKYDTAARALYCALLFSSLLCIGIEFNGILKPILSGVGLILLALSIFFFVKYDATTLEYILIERNGTLDFYVNKIVGRRGAYVVYYPLSDCVGYGEYKKEARSELKSKFVGCRFSKYATNFISSRELYYAVFEGNDGCYDVIIFEPSKEMIDLIEAFAGKMPMLDSDEE